MPKHRQNEIINCQYFNWKLLRRKGIYYTDGRSNSQDLGRHSLGTRERAEALENLRQLDLIKAVELGFADRSLLEAQQEAPLTIADGRTLYEEYCRRPPISGGPRSTTRKRYRPVLDKFTKYCQNRNIHSWNQLNALVLNGYAAWLVEHNYAYGTQYLELTTLKQIHKYFIENELLPSGLRFRYPIQKEDDSNTYCWSAEEIKAMLKLCLQNEFVWLRQVLLGLTATGMRISELAGLMWKDIDMQGKMITLVDESRRTGSPQQNKRTTKSGKSRSFPIHPDLMNVLESIEHSCDGRVFHGPLGGKIKPDTVRNILIREVLTPLAEQFPSGPDEVGFKDGRLHSFRHYFCSVCANKGTPERVLMNWLGHSSSKMVKRYYHLHDEESQKQMQRITFT